MIKPGASQDIREDVEAEVWDRRGKSGQGGGATRAQDQVGKKDPGTGAWGQDCLSEQDSEPSHARSSLQVVHGGSGDGSRNSALGPEI